MAPTHSTQPEPDLLLIDRIIEKPDATLSEIYIQGKKSVFKMLEDVVRALGHKIAGTTAVWAGRYLLNMRPSAHFSREYYTADDINLIPRKDWERLPRAKQDLYHEHDVIHVDGIADFAEILHHWGNTASDTRGCGLVGSSFGKLGPNTAVLASRDAYVRYYKQVAPLIRKGNQYITYRNSFEVITI